MGKRAAIIGAGVSGLTCGVLFAEGGWKVTILADAIGQKTTSGAAAAIWFPYDAGPIQKMIAWSLASYEKFRKLARDSNSGVSMIELRQFTRAGEIPVPDWAKNLGARRITKGGAIDPIARGRFGEPPLPVDEESRREVSSSDFPSGFTSGFALSVPLTDTTIYLDYLAKRFRDTGGTIQSAHVNNLEEISRDFGLIINCAGIGARELVHDSELEPHRGQVAIVPKLNLAKAIVCDDPPLMYAIPRAHDCVFGGTNSISENREPLPADTLAIVSECSRALDIDPPHVIAVRIGLRPFRKSGVRLESEKLRDSRTIIHNYGHGGAGFTLSWGCAEEVWALANRQQN